mmetsp:Transcript_55835/g.122041  ORF Transcript_55835/g.122041 Transcript_55835/m.122041 type:complete len:82 (-) Transcript_55835:386-631(-)
MRDWQGSVYAGTWDCLRQVLRNTGVKGLYAGLSYSLLLAVPAAGVTLTAYDVMMRLLTHPEHLSWSPHQASFRPCCLESRV